MAALEGSFGEDRALAVVHAGAYEVGIYADDHGADDRIVVATHRSGEWEGSQTHETFWDAMRAVAPEVDGHWDELPITREGHIAPVVVLPESDAYSALVRGPDGVVMATETPTKPGLITFSDRRWPNFVAAIDDLAFEGEFYG